MARTRVRWGRVAVLVTVTVSTLWVAGRAVGGSEDASEAGPAPSRRHVVAPGQTLWEIARGLAGPEGDPRPVIEMIRDQNGLGTALLVEGQTLVLPAG